MSISDGYVNVECDRCHEEEQMEMTALAQRGSYDMRNIEARMKRDGWRIEGDTHTCPDCVDEIAGAEEG